MIPETVFGLPAHILIVHGVVVLVPLAALGTIAIAAVPKWRAQYGVLVAALAVIAMLNTFVAVIAGQDFAESLPLGGPVAEKVATHSTLGEQLRWFALVLAIAAVGLVVAARRDVSRNVLIAISVVAVLAAGGATVWTVRTGHVGSEAVWNPTA